jgi:tetratricopeptide (TPR) repeat protein
MTGSRVSFHRAKALLAALIFVAPLFCLAARAADKKDKEKPEKEKKEKIEPYVEVRTAHFVVASDGGEKTARRIAGEFEALLREFRDTMPHARLSNGLPVYILAAKDGPSFGRLAPEFPYDKKGVREQPPGMMFSGPEKTYIGIRANASGRFRYTDIFQNYAKLVLKLSYRSLPPWLEEGYSTVYGNLTFTDRGLRLERPDPDDLSVLSESPLLSLEQVVLKADRKSPFYSPGNRSSVYFAESRVLVHMLISDQQYAFTGGLERYVTSLESGADPVQAARDAFGDLNQLQARLEAYVKNVSAPPTDIPSSSASDTGSAPRTLSAAEFEARMADFLALRGRRDDAEDRLEEALMTEPTLAEAEQDLGFIQLKKNDLDEAQKHFENAAKLEPTDGLNYYGQGLVTLDRDLNASPPPEAAAAFEKAASLNADFAPAWYYLGMIYADRDQTLGKALTDAEHAASLAPGESSYQLQVAALLNRMGHADEARKSAAQVQETATDKATAQKAGELVARLSPPPPPPAAPPRPPASTASPASSSTSTTAPSGNAPSKTTSDPGLRIERKTEPGVPPPATRTDTTAAAPPLVFADSTKVYSMVGTITDVNCAGAPQIQVTLKSMNIIMKLHAADLEKIEIKAAGSVIPAKGTTCSSLRGRTARISYFLVSQKAWDGEMQAVEFRSLP